MRHGNGRAAQLGTTSTCGLFVRLGCVRLAFVFIGGTRTYRAAFFIKFKKLS